MRNLKREELIHLINEYDLYVQRSIKAKEKPYCLDVFYNTDYKDILSDIDNNIEDIVTDIELSRFLIFK